MRVERGGALSLFGLLGAVLTLEVIFLLRLALPGPTGAHSHDIYCPVGSGLSSPWQLIVSRFTSNFLHFNKTRERKKKLKFNRENIKF